MPFADVDLIVQIAGSAMRWALGEGSVVEVWSGTQLLGTLSGETIRQLVAQHLSATALLVRMTAALAGEADRPPSPPHFPPTRAPSKDMLTREGKAARRQARRARKETR